MQTQHALIHFAQQGNIDDLDILLEKNNNYEQVKMY